MMTYLPRPNVINLIPQMERGSKSRFAIHQKRRMLRNAGATLKGLLRALQAHQIYLTWSWSWSWSRPYLYFI